MTDTTISSFGQKLLAMPSSTVNQFCESSCVWRGGTTEVRDTLSSRPCAGHCSRDRHQLSLAIGNEGRLRFEPEPQIDAELRAEFWLSNFFGR